MWSVGIGWDPVAVSDNIRGCPAGKPMCDDGAEYIHSPANNCWHVMFETGISHGQLFPIDDRWKCAASIWTLDILWPAVYLSLALFPITVTSWHDIHLILWFPHLPQLFQALPTRVKGLGFLRFPLAWVPLCPVQASFPPFHERWGHIRVSRFPSPHRIESGDSHDNVVFLNDTISSQFPSACICRALHLPFPFASSLRCYPSLVVPELEKKMEKESESKNQSDSEAQTVQSNDSMPRADGGLHGWMTVAGS